MKILVLSFYFGPDLSAGSFRTTALIQSLLEEAPNGTHIDVVTTLPNRYSSYSSEAPKLEERLGFTVHRIALPAHKSGMVDQSKAFLFYAKEVLAKTKGRDYDLVYATSSRLMTAALGAYVSKRKGVPLYLDIRDIFVDTINDVLPKKISRLVKPAFSFLESWTIRAATRVNVVSAGFLPYFRERYPQQDYAVFTNGIDDAFVNAQPEGASEGGHGVLEVVYAGNLGEGQGLHLIVPALAKRFEGRLHFKIIGDGGKRKELEEAVVRADTSNVTLLPPVSRETLIGIYQEADILFLHLNDYDAFRKVLPSKIFEYGALGKPIWAGVAGYAAEFIEENIGNAAVFGPCNDNQAEEVFGALRLETAPRAGFVEKYARYSIMRDMAKDIFGTIGASK